MFIHAEDQFRADKLQRAADVRSRQSASSFRARSPTAVCAGR